MRGVVAAGHPLTAAAGADVLRAGGTAVDAALAATMASFACEPWLTSLGAGGHMLVGAPTGEDVLLDFFVEVAGRDTGGRHGDLIAVDVSFGDALQVFHVGAPSCGTYGMPAGLCEAHRRWGTVPLPELAAAGVHLAREGVALTAEQAYVFEILAGITATSPEALEVLTVDGRTPREGDVVAQPELAGALERLAHEGERPFYEGDVADAVVTFLAERGGLLGAADLAAYQPVAREPVRVAYRGRQVVTNPPPSAGGTLIASALAELDAAPGPPRLGDLVAALRHAQERRTRSSSSASARRPTSPCWTRKGGRAR